MHIRKRHAVTTAAVVAGKDSLPSARRLATAGAVTVARGRATAVAFSGPCTVAVVATTVGLRGAGDPKRRLNAPCFIPREKDLARPRAVITGRSGASATGYHGIEAESVQIRLVPEGSHESAVPRVLRCHTLGLGEQDGLLHVGGRSGRSV